MHLYIYTTCNNNYSNLRAVMAKIFADAGVPSTIILDIAVGSIMERVDMVIVGAEGVMENGGIINKVNMCKL